MLAEVKWTYWKPLYEDERFVALEALPCLPKKLFLQPGHSFDACPAWLYGILKSRKHGRFINKVLLADGKALNKKSMRYDFTQGAVRLELSSQQELRKRYTSTAERSHAVESKALSPQASLPGGECETDDEFLAGASPLSPQASLTASDSETDDEFSAGAELLPPRTSQAESKNGTDNEPLSGFRVLLLLDEDLGGPTLRELCLWRNSGADFPPRSASSGSSCGLWYLHTQDLLSAPWCLSPARFRKLPADLKLNLYNLLGEEKRRAILVHFWLCNTLSVRNNSCFEVNRDKGKWLPECRRSMTLRFSASSSGNRSNASHRLGFPSSSSNGLLAPRDINGNISSSNIIATPRERKQTPATHPTHHVSLAQDSQTASFFDVAAACNLEHSETDLADLQQDAYDEQAFDEPFCFFTRALRIPQKEIHKRPEVVAARKKEIEGLFKDGCFRWVPRANAYHDNIKPIHNGFVDAVKIDEATGNHKFKSRLVLFGNLMSPFSHDSPYDKSAPVCSHMVMLTVLSFTAAVGFDFVVIDFTQAYSQADMINIVYAIPPDDFEDFRDPEKPEDDILQVLKALYASSQAGRRWHDKVARKLRTLGYTQSTIDACLFFLQCKEKNCPPVFTKVPGPIFHAFDPLSKNR
eukprot:g46216.t1